MRGLCRSGVASSTSMTSKPSSERPGGFWRKEEQRAPPRRRLCSAFPGPLAPPEHIQIGVGPLPGRRCLDALILKEPHYVRPLAPSGLSGPQLYVKEHLAPALYLPFQLDLKGVPLAQNEAIDHLLGGFGARRRRRLTRNMTYLAAVSLLCLVPFFVLSHEKCLLAHCTRYPPFCGAEPKRRRRLHDANGYQATSSDRCFYKYPVYQGSSGRSVS